MKKFRIVFVLLTMLVFSLYGLVISEEVQPNKIVEPQPVPGVIYKRYAVKSGIVEYIISGTFKGIEVVYFEDWGMREARHKKSGSEMLGFSSRLTVIERDWVYTIDLDNRLGTKAQDLDVKQILDEPVEISEVNIHERLLALWEAVPVSEEKVIEKSCKVWRVEKKGQKFWLWNWLPLKSETKTGVNETLLTAVSVNLDVPIHPEKFQIPDGIQYIQGDLDSILISAKPQPGKENL